MNTKMIKQSILAALSATFLFAVINVAASNENDQKLTDDDIKTMADRLKAFDVQALENNPTDPKQKLLAFLLRNMYFCVYKDNKELGKVIPSDLFETEIKKTKVKALTLLAALRYISSITDFAQQKNKDIVVSAYRVLTFVLISPIKDKDFGITKLPAIFPESILEYYNKFFSMEKKELVKALQMNKIQKYHQSMPEVYKTSDELLGISLDKSMAILEIADEYMKSPSEDSRGSWGTYSLLGISFLSLFIGAGVGISISYYRKNKAGGTSKSTTVNERQIEAQPEVSVV